MTVMERIAAMFLNRLNMSILVAGMCAICFLQGPGKAADSPGYFPAALSCGPSSYYHEVPPPAVLAQATAKPPLLLTQSFETLTRSVLRAKWLPEKFDDAKFLAMGEGAYRAQTCHLCKAYQRDGVRVTIKGFAGSVVAIFQPPPVIVIREAWRVLDEAAKHTDPCEFFSPYKAEGPPPAIAALLTAITDEVLTAAAYPPNIDQWNRHAKSMAMVRGGLWLQYLPRGPIYDLGLNADEAVGYSVTLWTDGRVLVVSIGGNSSTTSGSKLYHEVQPTVVIPTKGLQVPYVSKLTFAGEWTDAEGNLVVDRSKASHQRLYIDLVKHSPWRAVVGWPTQPAQIEQASWLCLARRTVGDMAGFHYESRWIKQFPTQSETLRNLTENRDRCMNALRSLKQAPCPKSLTTTREGVLGVLEVAKSVWDVAWPLWQTALTGTDAVDYKAVTAAVRADITAHKLPLSWDWDKAWKIIERSEAGLGINVDQMPGG